MFRYTFMEVLPFIFKVWKHVVINYTNKLKTKMGDIKQKACYRPNFNLEEIAQKRSENKKYGKHI